MTDEKDLDNVSSESDLRDAAENQLGKVPDVSHELKDLTSEKIIHELRVHQIELEMQNEELKRVQLELEASRDKFQDLYDSVPVGYFTLTHKGLIKEVNRTGALLLGMPRSKLINMRFGGFVTSESDDQWYRHIISAFGHEEKQSCVLTLKSEDGSSFYARLESVQQVAPVELRKANGGTLVVNVAVTDITERKRIEETLLASEERFRRMFESHSAIMLLIEPVTGRILDANRAAERFYGYTTTRLRSMSIWEINILPPDDVQKERNLALTEQRNHFIFPHRLADGEVKTVEVHSSPIEQNGEVMLFSIIHDITERKRLEEERLEIQHKLLLAQKLQSLAVMAAGIAHDFNNQLAVVLGNLELALADQTLDPETLLSIESAIGAARRSAELSRQMQVYTGNIMYFPVEIDLNELLNRDPALLKSTVSMHGALNFETNSALPIIKGDAEQLQRMVINILVNASEAIADKDGYVTLRTGFMDCDSAYLLRSRLEEKPAPGRFVFLEVADTGCGMDDATQRKLFDPFFSTKFTGRGLGMAEVMGTIKGHQGAIIVESEVGQGTTVRVLFPSLEKAPAAPVQVVDLVETKPPALETVNRRKTILLVEDEAGVRNLVVRRLDLLGYDTIAAVDGVEGVRIFRERLNEIDLVLLDFAMPKMNGVEAFEELIRIKPEVKVILSSGYTEEVLLQNFPGRRPAGVLHKPYKTEELKGELERLLGGDG